MERMRRFLDLVLLVAMLGFYLKTWPRQAICWLRMLVSKMGLSTDRDGPYILLRGMSAVCQTESTLSLLAKHPFPNEVLL